MTSVEVYGFSVPEFLRDYIRTVIGKLGGKIAKESWSDLYLGTNIKVFYERNKTDYDFVNRLALCIPMFSPCRMDRLQPPCGDRIIFDCHPDLMYLYRLVPSGKPEYISRAYSGQYLSNGSIQVCPRDGSFYVPKNGRTQGFGGLPVRLDGVSWPNTELVKPGNPPDVMDTLWDCYRIEMTSLLVLPYELKKDGQDGLLYPKIEIPIPRHSDLNVSLPGLDQSRWEFVSTFRVIPSAIELKGPHAELLVVLEEYSIQTRFFEESVLTVDLIHQIQGVSALEDLPDQTLSGILRTLEEAVLNLDVVELVDLAMEHLGRVKNICSAKLQK